MRILIVGSESEIVDFIIGALRAEGDYEFASASDGDEADLQVMTGAFQNRQVRVFASAQGS